MQGNRNRSKVAVVSLPIRADRTQSQHARFTITSTITVRPVFTSNILFNSLQYLKFVGPATVLSHADPSSCNPSVGDSGGSGAAQGYRAVSSLPSIIINLPLARAPVHITCLTSISYLTHREVFQPDQHIVRIAFEHRVEALQSHKPRSTEGTRLLISPRQSLQQHGMSSQASIPDLIHRTDHCSLQTSLPESIPMAVWPERMPSSQVPLGMSCHLV